MSGSVLFLQNRTHRAGAQTALLRLLRFRSAQGIRDGLVCSGKGWLAEQAQSLGVRTFEEMFPKSRTLGALLFSNKSFARRVASTVTAAGFKPDIVHANDHTESLLGLALARQLNARSAVFLRSSGMTENDYFRYRCERYDLVFAVGENLRSKVQAWNPSRKIELIFDGVEESEFLQPLQKQVATPAKILVLGTAGEAKGWSDLAEAINTLLARRITLPAFDFTSDSVEARNWFASPQTASVKYNFLGRIDAFRDLVRSYPLVLNPSRSESFGMAAIEVLAAGVPLLSSRSGVIEQVLTNPEVLFQPNDPLSLAIAMENALHCWGEIDFGVAEAQRRIRERFSIESAASQVDAAYQSLLDRN